MDAAATILREQVYDWLREMLRKRLEGQKAFRVPKALQQLDSEAKVAAVMLIGAVDSTTADCERAAEIAGHAIGYCEKAGWTEAVRLAICPILLPALYHVERYSKSVLEASLTWLMGAPERVPLPWRHWTLTKNLEVLADTAAELELGVLVRRAIYPLLKLLADHVSAACRERRWIEAAQYRGRYLRWWRDFGTSSSPDQPEGTAWDQDPDLAERIGEKVGKVHSLRLVHGALLMENVGTDGTLLNLAGMRSMDPRLNETVDKAIREATDAGGAAYQSFIEQTQRLLLDRTPHAPYRLEAAVEDLVPLRYQFSALVWARFAEGYRRADPEHAEAVLAALSEQVPDNMVGRETEIFPNMLLKLPHLAVRGCGYALRSFPEARVDFAALLEQAVKLPDLRTRAQTLVNLRLATAEVDEEIGNKSVKALLDLVLTLYHQEAYALVRVTCSHVQGTLQTLLQPSQRTVFAVYQDLAKAAVLPDGAQAELLHSRAKIALESGDAASMEHGIMLLNEVLFRSYGTARAGEAARRLFPALVERALREKRPSDLSLILALAEAFLELPEGDAAVVDTAVRIAESRLAHTRENKSGPPAEDLVLIPDLPEFVKIRGLLEQQSTEQVREVREEGDLEAEAGVLGPSAQVWDLIHSNRWSRAHDLLCQELEDEETKGPHSLKCWANVKMLAFVLYRCLEFYPEARGTLADELAELVQRYGPSLLEGTESDNPIARAVRCGAANCLGLAAVKLHPFLPGTGRVVLDHAVQLLEMAVRLTPRESDPGGYSFCANNLALAYGAVALFKEGKDAQSSLQQEAELLEEVAELDRELAAHPDPRFRQVSETLDLDLLNLGCSYSRLAERTYDATLISHKPLESARWLRKAVDALTEASSVAKRAGRTEIAATAEVQLAIINARLCEHYVIERSWARKDLKRAFYDWLCTVCGSHINTSEFMRLCGESALAYAERALRIGVANNPSLMLEAAQALMQVWSLANRRGGVWPYIGSHILLTLLESFEIMEKRGDFQRHADRLGGFLELRELAQAMFRVAWYEGVTEASEDLSAAHAGFVNLSRTAGIVTRAYARPRSHWLEVQKLSDGLLVNGLYLGKAKDGLELRIPSQRRRLLLGGVKVDQICPRLRNVEVAQSMISRSAAHLGSLFFWDDAPPELAVAELACSSCDQSFSLEVTRLPLSSWDSWVLELKVEEQGTLRFPVDLPFVGVYDMETRSLHPDRKSIENWREVLVFGQTGVTLEVTLPTGKEEESVVTMGPAERPEIAICASKTLLVLKSTPRITSANVGFFVKQDDSVAAISSAASFSLIAPGYSFPSDALHSFSPLFFFEDELPAAALELVNQLDLRELILVGFPENPDAADAALGALFDARRELFLLIEEEELQPACDAVQRLRQHIETTIGAAALMGAATSGSANRDLLGSIQIVVTPRPFAGAAAQMLLDLAAVRQRPLEGLLVRIGGKLSYLEVGGNPTGWLREATLFNGPVRWAELVARYAQRVQSPTGQLVFQTKEADTSVLDFMNPQLPRRPVFLFSAAGNAVPSLIPYMRHVGALPVPALEDGLALLQHLQPHEVYVPESLVSALPSGPWKVRLVPNSPADLARSFQRIIRADHARFLEGLATEYPHLLPGRALLEEMSPSEYVVLGLQRKEEAPWAYLAANYAAALGAPLLMVEEDLGNLDELERSLIQLRTVELPARKAQNSRVAASESRDVLRREVRQVPDLLRGFLYKTYQVLTEMQPVYIGFISSLASIPIELVGEPPLGTCFAIGRIAGPDLTTTGILVTRAALSEDIDRPAAIEALVAEAADALPDHPLTGARREATAIYKQLRKQPEIDIRLVQSSREEFLNGLRSSHLVHFAGHGTYDDADPARSGLYFSDGPLTVADFNIALGGAPIIFSNACETGRINRGDPSLGDQGWRGLAASVIARGAVNYLGSLWPIFDDTSRRAAEAFYVYLCSGLSVGEALRLARREIYHEKDPTWAAFILFGCPRNRLRAQHPGS